MKISWYNLFFISLLFFLLKLDVYAECSYDERNLLMDEAKNVNVNVISKTEIKTSTGISESTGEEQTLEYEVHSFEYNIANISDNLFIKYYNDFDGKENYINSTDLKNGIYTFIDNDENTLKTYYFEIRSRNENCSGKLVYTKKVIKPIFNSFSLYEVCNNEKVKDSKYCQKFITEKFNMTENDFLNWANKEINSNIENVDDGETSILDVLKSKWYMGIIFIVFIISIVFIILYIRKRRSEL